MTNPLDNACIADLQNIPIFADLEERQLLWLLDHCSCLELQTGEILWEKGQAADQMYVVLSGVVQIFIEVAGQTVTGTSERWGHVMGVLPYSRMVEFPGRAVATEPSKVLGIAKEHFPAMLKTIPELGYHLVTLMTDRVRSATQTQGQREKIMALGKLSAGLSHELNNPAAAVGRAADELIQRLEGSNIRIVRLMKHCLEPSQMEAVVALREVDEDATRLSTLERGDREDELGEWLEDLGLEDGFIMAATFVDAGLSADRLQEALGEIPEGALPDALAWIEGGLGARQLLHQVSTASSRITHLVKAVKAYSHMDQNPNKQPVDLHCGIEETLTILRYQIRKKRVNVCARYNDELPQVPVYPSEINQVWTNLLDNAIDAVAEGGEILVETDCDEFSAFVRIHDNGEGIPEDEQIRIFEPFFTTKPVGEGTGLGLDIVQRIVVQHGGEITCESEPGSTIFTVRLPLETT